MARTAILLLGSGLALLLWSASSPGGAAGSFETPALPDPVAPVRAAFTPPLASRVLLISVAGVDSRTRADRALNQGFHDMASRGALREIEGLAGLGPEARLEALLRPEPRAAPGAEDLAELLRRSGFEVALETWRGPEEGPVHPDFEDPLLSHVDRCRLSAARRVLRESRCRLVALRLTSAETFGPDAATRREPGRLPSDYGAVVQSLDLAVRTLRQSAGSSALTILLSESSRPGRPEPAAFDGPAIRPETGVGALGPEGPGRIACAALGRRGPWQGAGEDAPRMLDWSEAEQAAWLRSLARARLAVLEGRLGADAGALAAPRRALDELGDADVPGAFGLAQEARRRLEALEAGPAPTTPRRAARILGGTLAGLGATLLLLRSLRSAPGGDG